MLLSKFMYFIHLHHICGINRQIGVSQGSMSQSRQGTPSVTATCLVLFVFVFVLILFFTQSFTMRYDGSYHELGEISQITESQHLQKQSRSS